MLQADFANTEMSVRVAILSQQSASVWTQYTLLPH
jgi:hypothetical protein